MGMSWGKCQLAVGGKKLKRMYIHIASVTSASGYFTHNIYSVDYELIYKETGKYGNSSKR